MRSASPDSSSSPEDEAERTSPPITRHRWWEWLDLWAASGAAAAPRAEGPPAVAPEKHASWAAMASAVGPCHLQRADSNRGSLQFQENRRDPMGERSV